MELLLNDGNDRGGMTFYHVGEVAAPCRKFANHAAIKNPIGMRAVGVCPKTQQPIELIVDEYEAGFLDGSIFFVRGRIIRDSMLTKERGALSLGYVPGKPRKLGFTLHEPDGLTAWTTLGDCLAAIPSGGSVRVPSNMFAITSFVTMSSNIGRALNCKFTIVQDGNHWIISRAERGESARDNYSTGVTSDVKNLRIGESVEIKCEYAKVQSVRNAATREAGISGSSFKVTRTPDGCTVTRTS